MTVHLSFFVVASVLETTSLTISIIQRANGSQAPQQESSVRDQRISDTKVAIDSASNFVWCVIVITMCLMYLRYSAPLS